MVLSELGRSPSEVNNHGKVLLVPNLYWKNIRLKEKLTEKVQLSCIIENEANAAAYGEKSTE